MTFPGPRDSSRLSERASRPLPALLEYLPTLPGLSDGTLDLLQPSQPLMVLRKGPQTPPRPLGGPPNPSSSSWRVPDPSHLSGRTSGTLPVHWDGLLTSPNPPNPYQASLKASRPDPGLREGLPNPSAPPGGPAYPSWPSWRAFRPRPSLLEGLLTPPAPPRKPPNPFGRDSPGLRNPCCLARRASQLLPALQKDNQIPPGSLGGLLTPPRRTKWVGSLLRRDQRIAPPGRPPNPPGPTGGDSQTHPSFPIPSGPPGGHPNPSQPSRPPPGSLEEPSDPSRLSGRTYGPNPAVRVCLPNLSWLSGRASLALPALLEASQMGEVGSSSRPFLAKPPPPGSPEATPDSSLPTRRASWPLPAIWEGLPIPPGPPGRPQPLPSLWDGLPTSPNPADPYWAFLRGSRPIPALRAGLPNPPAPPGGPAYHSRLSGRDSRPLIPLPTPPVSPVSLLILPSLLGGLLTIPIIPGRTPDLSHPSLPIPSR